MTYNADGQLNLTAVDGSSYTGLYAADGSWNIVINDGSTIKGRYHPCGALNAVVVTDPSSSFTNPNGSINVIADGLNNYVPISPKGTGTLAPSWVLTGNHVPATIDMNFAGNQYYGGTVGSLLSVTNSSGYATNADGTLTLFGSNTPRIGLGTGLLIEEARINNIARSQAPSFWGVNNVTLADNATAAPDGTTTAGSITRNSTVASAYAQPNTVSVSASTTYTLSVFAKAKAVDGYIGMRFQGVYPIRADGLFNLNNGTIVGSAGNTFTSVSATITALANGWYRLTLTATLDASTTSISPILGPASSSSTVGGWESATATLSDVYVWGAQFEQGSFATSYIPTTTTAVTRVQDFVTGIGSLTALPPVGTLRAAYNSAVSSNTSLRYDVLGQGNDGANNNRWALRHSDGIGSPSTSFQIGNGSSVNGTSTGVLLNANTNYAQAVSWSATAGSQAINGTVYNIGGVPPSGWAPAGGSVILGNVPGANAIGGYIRRISIWPNNSPNIQSLSLITP